MTIFCHDQFKAARENIYLQYPELFREIGRNRRRGHLYYGWTEHRLHRPYRLEILTKRRLTLTKMDQKVMEWEDDWMGRWILTYANALEIKTLIQNLSCDEEEEEEEKEQIFLCPITREIMCDPVLLAADGHSYEREAISTWLSQHARSPMTGLDILEETDRMFYPNITLRHAILQSLE